MSHLLTSGAAPREKSVKSGALLRAGRGKFASGGTRMPPFVSSRLLIKEKTASLSLQDDLPDLYKQKPLISSPIGQMKC